MQLGLGRGRNGVRQPPWVMAERRECPEGVREVLAVEVAQLPHGLLLHGLEQRVPGVVVQRRERPQQVADVLWIEVLDLGVAVLDDRLQHRVAGVPREGGVRPHCVD